MEHWWEIAIGVVIVVAASLLLGFQDIPDGGGKLFAYLGAGFIPVLIIQFKKMKDLGANLTTGQFVGALILNTFLVLFFSVIILVTMGKV